MSAITDPAAWLAKADNDLLTIENDIRAQRVPWDVVCYHAQQVAEKVLKAYRVTHAVTPPKAHDLVVLLGQCVGLGAPVADLEADCRPTDSGGVARIAALYARAMSSGVAPNAGRSRRFGRFGRTPTPDVSGDVHPASREITQERTST